MAELYSRESVLSTIAIVNLENKCFACTNSPTYSVFPMCLAIPGLGQRP